MLAALAAMADALELAGGGGTSYSFSLFSEQSDSILTILFYVRHCIIKFDLKDILLWQNDLRPR